LAGCLLALPLCFLQAASQKTSWEEIFFDANKAYKEGHFQDAVDGYNRLIEGGFDNGHLYFNLGNAYFRLNRLGDAILNFERARLRIPRDPDLRFNLGHARDQTVDALVEADGLLGMVFFWLETLNTAEVFWAFAVSNMVFWAILLLRLFTRSEWTYYACLVAVVVWIVCGASFGVKWFQTKKDARAVVLSKEVNVLAGPETGDTVLFKLHEGTVVRHERSEDGWCLIGLSEKRRGWVKASAVERIVPDALMSTRPQPRSSVSVSTKKRAWSTQSVYPDPQSRVPLNGRAS
jgi:tetratricopeptide (TPR) repeat protein